VAPSGNPRRGAAVTIAPVRPLRRVARLTIMVAALVLPSCESAPGPPPSSDVHAATEALRGEWIVTTRETLAAARYFQQQIDAATSHDERVRLEQVRDLNLRRLAPIVKANAFCLGFHMPWERGYADCHPYVVLRATRDEITIHIEGSEVAETVLTLSGRDELRAPDLFDFARGTTWHRAGTTGVGQ
jgi:hypothetical protein